VDEKRNALRFSSLNNFVLQTSNPEIGTQSEGVNRRAGPSRADLGQFVEQIVEQIENCSSGDGVSDEIAESLRPWASDCQSEGRR
jgi:hypothetical protein